MAIITLYCPKCEKNVQLDNGQEFGFCMYCGQKIAIPKVEIRDYNEVFPKAEAGDVVAQYDLATMYRKGWGVEQSYTEAVKWYKLAAEQGDPYAYYQLGYLCAAGQGMKRNCSVAARYFEEAKKHGLDEINAKQRAEAEKKKQAEKSE